MRQHIWTPYSIHIITSYFTQETTHKDILAAHTCEIIMNTINAEYWSLTVNLMSMNEYPYH